MVSRDERFQILFSEMELIQHRFARYDELLWKSRSWAVAFVSALIGWAIVMKSGQSPQESLLLIAAIVAGLFWIEEGLLGFAYVYKYVVRYRRLRGFLNGDGPDLNELPLYDLTNHIEGRGARWPRLRFAFFRLERVLFFVILGLTPIVVGWVLP